MNDSSNINTWLQVDTCFNFPVQYLLCGSAEIAFTLCRYVECGRYSAII